MPVSFRETRDIAAPASAVYRTLVDLERYSEWNPWLTKARGEVSPNALVEVWPVLNGKTHHYEHRILAAEPDRRLLWCDLGWFTLFAKGERERTLTPTGEASCRYEVELRIGGPFAKFAERSYGKALRDGLRSESDALKVRCEVTRA